MTAPFIFRYRYALHVFIFVLGFVAPWNYALHLDHGRTVWEYLGLDLFQHRWLSFEAASVTLLLMAIAFAAAGAWLRTWGTAYLGSGVVKSPELHDGGLPPAPGAVPGSMPGSVPGSMPGIVASGPYRYLRNPLYLGTFLHALALALIMPPSGAVFTVVAIAGLQFALIFAEEPFLLATLGESYRRYCARVPRLLPALPARVPAGAERPRWGQAVLGEIYMIVVPLGFAIFGWSYNANLLTRCVIVAFGLALVARALTPKRLS